MGMAVTEERIRSGQSVYSKWLLVIYDFMVIVLSNRFIWHAPKKKTVRYYSKHVSNNHLDIGAGTGYFLDKCTFPQPLRLAVMDMNPNCLEKTSRRVHRYSPELYQMDIFKPLKIEKRFDSCSLNFFFHCLPGDMASKMVVFDNLREVLNPGATVFGTTVLYTGVAKSRWAEKLMVFYNKKKIFCNSGDSLKALAAGLEKRFSDYELTVVGCVAFFVAKY